MSGTNGTNRTTNEARRAKALARLWREIEEWAGADLAYELRERKAKATRAVIDALAWTLSQSDDARGALEVLVKIAGDEELASLADLEADDPPPGIGIPIRYECERERFGSDHGISSADDE